MARIILRELVTRWGFDVDDSELIKLQRRERELRKQFVKLGAVATAALAAVAIPAANLEDALRRSAAAAGKVGADFDATLSKLTGRAQDFAEDFGLAGVDVARGFFDVISAGVDPLTEGFDKFARTGLALAKVAGGDVGQAIEALKPTMQSFSIATEDALIVADKFAKANQTGATSVAQIAEAMTLAAPVMAQTFGQTIDTTTALLIGFAEAGFRARRGGEALKQTALVLAAPTNRAANEMKRLGIQTTDAEDNFLNIIDIIQQFEERLGGMAEAQKALSLEQIFGRETVGKFSALLAIGTDKLRDFEKASSESEGALALSLEQMQGTTEGFRRMVQAVKNLAIALGTPLLEPFKKVFDAMRRGARSIRDFLQENEEFTEAASKVFGLVTAFVALGSALGVVLSTIKITTAGMKLLGLATLKTQLAALLLPFVLAAAIIALGLLIHDIIKFFQGGQSEIASMLDKMKDFRTEIGFMIGAAAVLLTAFLVAFAPMLVLLATIVALPILIALEWDKLSLFWKQLTTDWKGTFSDFLDFLDSQFGLSFDNILKTAIKLNRDIGKLIAAQLPGFVQRALGVSPEDIARLESAAAQFALARERLGAIIAARKRAGLPTAEFEGRLALIPNPAADAAQRVETTNNINNGGSPSTVGDVNIIINPPPGTDPVQVGNEVEKRFGTILRDARSAVTFTPK